KAFKDEALKSFSTLGSKFSKYSDPEHKFVKPYPNARLGFILASPVFLLREGTRTITIKLACELEQNSCEDRDDIAGEKSSCCDGDDDPAGIIPGDQNIKFKQAGELHAAVMD